MVKIELRLKLSFICDIMLMNVPSISDLYTKKHIKLCIIALRRHVHVHCLTKPKGSICLNTIRQILHFGFAKQ